MCIYIYIDRYTYVYMAPSVRCPRDAEPSRLRGGRAAAVSGAARAPTTYAQMFPSLVLRVTVV